MRPHHSSCRGTTLLDTLVGIALMLLVFVGITAVFQLSINVVTNNKARTGALALSQERIEFIRSLSYSDVGTVGGIPSGDLEQTESISLNGVSYTRTTLVRYMDDPKDGEGDDDENDITADSKEVKVTTSWTGKSGARSVLLTSRVSPPGIEQAVPGGTISILVRDADLDPVSGASVSIENNSVSPSVDVDVLTNTDGEATFIGAPEGTGYEVVATKSGFSSAQTYTADAQNPNPDPGHLTVADGATTVLTLRIDELSTKTIRTFEQNKEVVWTDPFDSKDFLASTTQTVVASGNLKLTGPGEANSPGFALSTEIVSPDDVQEWKELSWDDDDPVDTQTHLRLYYDAGGSFEPVPDADLPGNEDGFIVSPVDLTGLPATTYSDVRVHLTLTSHNNTETPRVDEYALAYIEGGGNPLPNIAFRMHGNKSIGTDDSGTPIYKYDENLDVGPDSSVTLTDFEWDTYTISVDGATIGYDIAESCEPQPRTLDPDTTMTTNLFFAEHTAHSLLVDVRDTSGALLEGASVRLYRTSQGPNYDETNETGTCGQTFFSGLSEGTVENSNAYSIDVTANGYQPFSSSGNVDISGASRFSVILNSL